MVNKEFFLENKNGSRLKPKSLKNENIELYKEIIEFNKKEPLNSLPFKEQVWLYVHNLKETPKCLVCGSDTKFDRFSSGYRTFCSLTCKSNSKQVKTKTEKTNLERYGGHPMNNDKIKSMVESTNLKKYGHKSHLSSKQIKSKIENTNIKKYGVKRPLMSDDIFNKTKKTMHEKYGVDHGLQSKDIHNKTVESNKSRTDWSDVINKIKETNREKYGVDFYNNQQKNEETCLERYGVKNVLESGSNLRPTIQESKLLSTVNSYEHGNKIEILEISGDTCLVKCHSCDNTINMDRHFMTMRGKSGRVICTNCNPYGNRYSSSTIEIEEFIGGDIIKNDRKTLNGLEIDILVPKNKVGIEYNGVYWHSELYKDKNYHLNKTLLSKENGIDLLHIFEDEWLYKKDIVKSIINNKLRRNINTVYARKCGISEITPKQSREFLNENHIQGNVNSSIKLGLFYNNKLISVMTFGKNRVALGGKGGDGYEMFRFCNKLNTSVVGGASKLFNFFVKKYEPKKITSYSDNRYFNGDLYNKLGFTYEHDSKPSYWYVVGDTRFHRFKYRKDVLVRDGYDSNKTEHQIMLERGIYRIYDCGNKKWVWGNK